MLFQNHYTEHLFVLHLLSIHKHVVIDVLHFDVIIHLLIEIKT